MRDAPVISGASEDDGDSETERPIESGRSETEEEREDPTRAPYADPIEGEGSAENTTG